MPRLSSIFLAVLMLLAACHSYKSIEAVACSNVIDPKILSFPWEKITADELEAWMDTNYPEVTYLEKQANNDFVQLGWIVNDEVRDVYFEGRVREFYLGLASKPTVGDLLRCYGEPEYYATEYTQAPEAAAIRLTIWYPELGLTFVSEEYSSWRFTLKTKFDRWTRLYSATVVEPGTIEEVLKRGTAYDEIVNETLGVIQPWPKDFQVIEHKLQ